MYKYALVSAYKDRYDRPINIELIAIFDIIEDASLYLKENYVKEDKNIKEAIEKKYTWVCGEDDEHYYLQYLDGVLISYKTGCSALNEYIGESYEILKMKA